MNFRFFMEELRKEMCPWLLQKITLRAFTVSVKSVSGSVIMDAFHGHVIISRSAIDSLSLRVFNSLKYPQDLRMLMQVFG